MNAAGRFLIFVSFCMSICLPVFSQTPVDSIEMAILHELQQKPVYIHKKLEITDDQAMRIIDRMPSFGVYKDTYFLTGVPLNEKIDKTTADATFQLSIRQRLTKSILPFKTFLYLTYTQKNYWNIYDESSPFRDTNYNPGLGFGRYLIHNNELLGSAFIQLEHESNGKDSTDSRSWNYISISGKYFFNLRLSMQLELWIPYVDGGENKDLLNYKGLGTFSINYIDRNDRIWLSADINPRKGIGNVNLNLSLGYKVSTRSNQYIYAQFYSGYAESLLDYNKYSSYFRVGFCIKPDFYSLF